MDQTINQRTGRPYKVIESNDYKAPNLIISPKRQVYRKGGEGGEEGQVLEHVQYRPSIPATLMIMTTHSGSRKISPDVSVDKCSEFFI